MIMVVKSSLPDRIMIIVIFLLANVFPVFIWIEWSPSWHILLPYFLIMNAFSVLYWIAFGRTITFESTGCIIRFLFFKKKYTWDELKLKKYVCFLPRSGQPFNSGAIFYHKPIKKKFFPMPENYCVFRHPFLFFFVYFVPEGLSFEQRQYGRWYYVVDETEFRQKLDEWCVEMQ